MRVASFQPAEAARPLAGFRVAIVHPAWHSCGTYRVVCAQVGAYLRLGAQVVTVACSDQPLFVSPHSRLRRVFRAKTGELEQTHRLFAGAPLRALVHPRFTRDVLWPYLHGDQAVIRTGMASRSILTGPPSPAPIDLVHCNHFFCMPVARRLAPRAPTIVETHDVQADQFVLINEGRRVLPPRTGREHMLHAELYWLRQADAIVHLNAAEDVCFRTLLPDARHELIYPAIAAMPPAVGARPIIVASGNASNTRDLVWFLSDVLPLRAQPDLSIYGSIDRSLAAARPDLHRKYSAFLKGSVDDLAPIYASAGVVLLPGIAGHGLSIKAVEALSSGAQIVATPRALRGMPPSFADLPHVHVADDAASFAAAMETARCAAGRSDAAQMRARRAAFDTHFGADIYTARIGALAGSLTGR